LSEHQPFETNIRKFLFDALNDVNGRAGAIIEDATEGSGGGSDVTGEHLLSHVSRLHNLSDSVLHFFDQVVLEPKKALFFSVYKGKAKK